MTYEDYLIQLQNHDVVVTQLSNELNAFPKSANGLTPEHIRLSPEYRAALNAYTVEFRRMQQFNKATVKTHGKRRHAEKRAAREKMFAEQAK